MSSPEERLDAGRLKQPDPSHVLKLQNSIKEGQIILRGKLSPAKRKSIERGIVSTAKKLERFLNYDPDVYDHKTGGLK